MNPLQEALKRYKDETAQFPKPLENQKAQLYSIEPSERQSESLPYHINYTQSRCVEVSRELLQQHRLLNEDSSPLFLESYKRLKTQVLHRFHEHHWTVLGIFSPRSQVGATLTAVNLAIALGMDMTLTVLLAEGNLQEPSLQRLFGFPPGSGLAEYLQVGTPLADCLVHPNLGRLVVLPGGEPVSSSLEFLTSPVMVDLVQEMKSRYVGRLIIFDLPPLLESSDTLAFCPFLDASLLVVEEGKTTKFDVEESLQLLQGSVPVLGTVCNKVGRQTLSLKSARHVARSGQPSDSMASPPLWKRIFQRGD